MYIKWNPFLITFQTVTWGISCSSQTCDVHYDPHINAS
uniref:Uncharacterized protein n=1 Tax=Anguilla anguilla TaxID=7936 RepID=A0A0E9RXW4_ANGAN